MGKTADLDTCPVEVWLAVDGHMWNDIDGKLSGRKNVAEKHAQTTRIT